MIKKKDILNADSLDHGNDRVLTQKVALRELAEQLLKERDAYREVAQKYCHIYGNSDGGMITGIDAHSTVDAEAQKILKGE